MSFILLPKSKILLRGEFKFTENKETSLIFLKRRIGFLDWKICHLKNMTYINYVTSYVKVKTFH